MKVFQHVWGSLVCVLPREWQVIDITDVWGSSMEMHITLIRYRDWSVDYMLSKLKLLRTSVLTRETAFFTKLHLITTVFRKKIWPPKSKNSFWEKSLHLIVRFRFLRKMLLVHSSKKARFRIACSEKIIENFQKKIRFIL